MNKNLANFHLHNPVFEKIERTITVIKYQSNDNISNLGFKINMYLMVGQNLHAGTIQFNNVVILMVKIY
jgi:hypothetical protein